LFLPFCGVEKELAEEFAFEIKWDAIPWWLQLLQLLCCLSTLGYFSTLAPNCLYFQIECLCRRVSFLGLHPRPWLSMKRRNVHWCLCNETV
jgi:hypothetical protein